MKENGKAKKDKEKEKETEKEKEVPVFDTSKLATKADVDAAKADILSRIDKLENDLKTSLKQFGPILERLTGLLGKP